MNSLICEFSKKKALRNVHMNLKAIYDLLYLTKPSF